MNFRAALFMAMLLAPLFFAAPVSHESATPLAPPSTVNEIIVNGSREPAFAGFGRSKVEAGQACVAALEDAGDGVFNIAIFDAALQEFQAKGSVSGEDLKFAVGVPERYLAALEFTSKKEAYGGLEFSSRIKSLSKRRRRLLYATLNDVLDGVPALSNSVVNAPKVKLTAIEQNKLLTEVYDIVHRPRPVFLNAYDLKSFTRARQQRVLEKTRKRLDLSLAKEGMPATFGVITADPKLTEKFKAVLTANRKWIDPLVFVSLWIPFAIYYDGFVSPYAGETIGKLAEILRWMPPYIPNFSTYFNDIVTPEDRANALEKGPEYAVQQIYARMGKGMDLRAKLNLSSKVYSAIFNIIMATTVAASVHADYVEQAREDQIMSQQNVNTAVSTIGDLAHYDQMDPHQRADASVRAIVALGDAKGEKVDGDSPEMKWLNDQMTKAYVKQDEAEKKKPNSQ